MDDFQAEFNCHGKPFRVNLTLTVNGSIADPEKLMDSLIDQAHEAGAFLEWGEVEEMSPEDVVPDSPLARSLAGEKESSIGWAG